MSSPEPTRPTPPGAAPAAAESAAQPHRTRHAAVPGPQRGDALALEALRLALRSGDPQVVRVLAALTDDLAETRERVHRLENWLLLVLEEVGGALPGAAVLRSLLPEDPGHPPAGSS
ncbi:MAG: hypothetical protein ACYDB7_08695 [Mycobacteriales bacterium]